MYIKEILRNSENLTFCMSNGSKFEGRIVDCHNNIFVTIEGYMNRIVFDLLKIKNRNKFVEDIVGYFCTGDWPEVKTHEDLQKVLEALEKVNKPSVEITDDTKTSCFSLSINNNQSINLNFKL